MELVEWPLCESGTVQNLFKSFLSKTKPVGEVWQLCFTLTLLMQEGLAGLPLQPTAWTRASSLLTHTRIRTNFCFIHIHAFLWLCVFTWLAHKWGKCDFYFSVDCFSVTCLEMRKHLVKPFHGTVNNKSSLLKPTYLIILLPFLKQQLSIYLTKKLSGYYLFVLFTKTSWEKQQYGWKLRHINKGTH